MASKKVFDLMEAEAWNEVRELLTNNTWTSQDLEEKQRGKEDTLLIKAARLGKEDVVCLLLHAGAAIEATNKNGCSALYCAAEEGHLRAVEILLDRGADIETRTTDGLTPLITAAYYGSSELVALLVEKGANIQAQDDDGWTALHWAVQEGHLRAVEILLDREEDIDDVRSEDGRSALIVSAIRGHVEVAKLLCGKGADLNIVDDDGHDALYYADEEVITVIQEEAEWRRVANFVVFLHTGGLSSADWSVRMIGGGGLMPTMDCTATAHSDIPASGGVTLNGRQSKVLENRDLCRIVGSYIPKPL